MSNRLPLARLALAGALVLSGVACGGSNTTPDRDPLPSPSLAGTVTDASSNAAVSGVQVEAQGKSVTTGSDGKYSLTGLTAGAATLLAKHQGHDNFTQAVTVTGGASTVDIKMTPAAIARMAGAWTGTWRNTTFNSGDSATLNVSVDTILQTVQATIDLNGNVFGSGDPPPETFNGTYTAGGTTLAKSSATLGQINITVTSGGQITGSCTNIPGGTISRIDITGTSSPTAINISYTMAFSGGGGAVGTLTFTK